MTPNNPWTLAKSKNKDKKKLRGGFDAFERDRGDAFRAKEIERKFCVGLQPLETARSDFGPRLGEGGPLDPVLRKSCQKRAADVANGDRVLATSEKMIEKAINFDKDMRKDDQARRQRVKDVITDVSLKLSEKLTQHEMRQLGEITRLNIENSRLALENETLRTTANSSIGAEQMGIKLREIVEGGFMQLQQSGRLELEEKPASMKLKDTQHSPDERQRA
jgi:hypothetical protein